MPHCLLRLLKITRKNKHYTNVSNRDKLITDIIIIFKNFTTNNKISTSTLSTLSLFSAKEIRCN